LNQTTSRHVTKDSSPHSLYCNNNIINSFKTHHDMRRHITEPVHKVTSLLTLLFFQLSNL